MERIYIPRLTRLPEQTEVLEFEETIPGLDTLTPVKGQLQVTHQGNYLEISAKAETIITLTCHRCLQQYNYRLAIQPSELIWLNESATPEQELFDRELGSEDLVETLPPQGYFDPVTWLYEQLCLEIPQQQLCDRNCQGIAIQDKPTSEFIDSRWASLQTIKNQLSNN